MCHAVCSVRDNEAIETELMEISAIADDSVKLERIIAWCSTHPDEVPFALYQLMNRRDKNAAAAIGRRRTALQAQIPNHRIEKALPKHAPATRVPGALLRSAG
jgi:hypothetical protein